MELENSFTHEADISRLRRELEEEKNRHLRTLADFDNYRKRVERDAQRRSSEDLRNLLLDLIGVLNNFEPAVKQIEDETVAQGLRLIYAQYIELLRRHGVKPFDSVGRPFNPEEQEGVGYVENYDYPEGYVAEEVRRGYKMGDEILQPARVRVAKRGL